MNSEGLRSQTRENRADEAENLVDRVRNRVKEAMEKDPGTYLRWAADIASIAVPLLGMPELMDYGFNFDVYFTSPAAMKVLWLTGPLADLVSGVVAGGVYLKKGENQFSSGVFEGLKKRWWFTSDEEKELDAKIKDQRAARGIGRRTPLTWRSRTNEYSGYWLKKVVMRNFVFQSLGLLGSSVGMNIAEHGVTPAFNSVWTSITEGVRNLQAQWTLDAQLADLDAQRQAAVQAEAAATQAQLAEAAAARAEAMRPVTEAIAAAQSAISSAGQNVETAVNPPLTWQQLVLNNWNVFLGTTGLLATAAGGAAGALVERKFKPVTTSLQWIKDRKADLDAMGHRSLAKVGTVLRSIEPVAQHMETNLAISQKLTKEKVDEIILDTHLNNYFTQRFALEKESIGEITVTLPNVLLDLLVLAANLHFRTESGTNRTVEGAFVSSLNSEEALDIMEWCYGETAFNELLSLFGGNTKNVKYNLENAVAKYNNMHREYSRKTTDDERKTTVLYKRFESANKAMEVSSRTMPFSTTSPRAVLS